MWKKVDLVNERDFIFHEVLEECKRAVPGARLPHTTRTKLERLPVEVRRDVVNRVKLGCSPLFTACKRGRAEIVEYLITVCSANIELCGIYEVQDDRSTHVVTPLWCAAVSGKLPVVEILLKYGADINAVSDSGSTPIRSACFMTHFEIVKYLVEHGADINKPNYNGGTCLINSVQSPSLCEILIKHGADVNARDIQNKTALHYAIQEHRLETTRLLLANGANHRAESKYGDDALQMACLKGAKPIFDFLTSTIKYSPEKLANSHELLGASYLEEQNDVIEAIAHWREALWIRQTYGLFPKQPISPPQNCYRGLREFETLEDLDNVASNFDVLHLQSLMLTERILGPQHKDTIFRLMYRGASYADISRYQRCIDLWQRALQIRIEKDTMLFTDTCFTSQALIRLMIDYNVKSLFDRENNATQRFQDVVATFKLITCNIVELRQLLTIKPIYKRQADFFDKMLKCVTHLIFLMIETASQEEDMRTIKTLTKEIIKKNIKCVLSEDSLLHLCVSKLNTIRSSYFVDEEPVFVFPNVKVAKFLLDCGAPPNCRNEQGATPLFVATINFNYSDLMVRLLLDYGAHIDQPNLNGKRPCDQIAEMHKYSNTGIHVINYMSLKCMCANVIIAKRIQYVNQIPKTLENFVKLHKPRN